MGFHFLLRSIIATFSAEAACHGVVAVTWRSVADMHVTLRVYFLDIPQCQWQDRALLVLGSSGQYRPPHCGVLPLCKHIFDTDHSSPVRPSHIRHDSGIYYDTGPATVVSNCR